MSHIWHRRRFGAIGSGSWIDRPLSIVNPEQIRIGQRTFIRAGARLEVVTRPGLAPGSLIIGDDVGIEQHSHIIASNSVVLADQVTIGPRVTILDCEHPPGSITDGPRYRTVSRDAGYVRIGRRAFLGANVVVMPNVSIGENAIVGAGSVVTRDVPADCVAAGAPATVIRRLNGEEPNDR